MSLEPFKVLFQVHMLRKDDEGRVIGEPLVSARIRPDGQQETLVLYPHQFDEMPQRVAALVSEVEGQLAAEAQPEAPETEAPPAAANRAQRRAAVKRSKR